jgi:phosphoserine phosphatase
MISIPLKSDQTLVNPIDQFFKTLTHMHTNGLTLKDRTAPLKLSNYKLIAFDMDSTLINIECIDEIAGVAGLKSEVAKITELTMRGEIKDFQESLRRRVGLLKGTPVSALEEVYKTRLKLNPGAENLLQICRSKGLKTLLVSGGFTYFATRVQQLLAIDRSRSNELEIKDGVLTGGLVAQAWGEICDGEEKKRTLIQTCTEHGFDLSQAIAVGDGSNDIPMMLACSEAGGLSVAYHAKPIVKEKALICIEEGPLDRMLELFEI